MKKLKLIPLLLISLLLAGCENQPDFKVALSLQEQGMYEEAIKEYEKLPDNNKAKNNIKLCNAALLVENKNKELDEVLSKAKEAVESRQKSFNEKLREDLQGMILEAETNKYIVDPTELDQTALMSVDYTETIEQIQRQTDLLQKSQNARALGETVTDIAGDTWEIFGGDNMIDSAKGMLGLD